MKHKPESLSHGEYWCGSYRGVGYEIKRWSFSDGTPVWNYYLRIPLDQVPEGKRDLFDLEVEYDEKHKHRSYRYMVTGIFRDLYWHGGITYYAKLGGLDGFPVIIEAGCDFNHYWDEGMRFCLEGVQKEAHRTIDDLWDRVPNLYLRCRYTGKFVPEAEGEYNEHGLFMSQEGLKQQAEWKAEREAEKAKEATEGQA